MDLLKELDTKAETFEFPVLDNANWDYGGGRIRGFRAGDKVALVFELMVFLPGSLQFLVDIYAFGDLLQRDGGYSGSWTLFSELAEHPLWDGEGEWISGASNMVVALNEAQVVEAAAPGTSWTRPGAIQVRLSAGDERAEGDLIAALARELGMRVLVPDETLFEHVPELVATDEVARLSCWDHPDVAEGELPSASRSLQALVSFLLNKTTRLEHDHEGDNSDRRSWSAE
ncbi:DUF7003 family protein [Longimicrobium terrae]|uniref:Uncharacterized protein n=1 Tax=Longimicrobium terrae TaxID=1639882 RepID=A0A841GR23_9BACT|nr:hypothetical protein [Longimicrobium terrae]MBB4635618.1 hypothetical protein [Longimicrobium terrae]MBB6070012.1 hypothetical protein [Longimicrobium terrae]NNC32922.1 hypothetical protein [Longimicrobium terrae]